MTETVPRIGNFSLRRMNSTAEILKLGTEVRENCECGGELGFRFTGKGMAFYFIKKIY